MLKDFKEKWKRKWKNVLMNQVTSRDECNICSEKKSLEWLNSRLDTAFFFSALNKHCLIILKLGGQQ